MTERSNEKALKIIEQQYDDFINQTNSWGFFRGLASYIKTTQELLQTQPLINALEQQRKVTRMVYEQTNTQAFKEMMRSAEKVVEITKDLTKQLKPVAITINKVQDQLKGNLLSSYPLNTLNRNLFDVAIVLKQNGYANIIKQFEDDKRKRENIFGNYTFSPAYEKLAEEKEKLERKEQVEPWGAWQGLPLVKKIVFEPDELAKELKKETSPDKRWAIINLFGVMGELEQIRSGRISDNDIVFFKIEHYKDCAKRVHQYLLKELIQSDDKSDIDNTILKFDTKKSILHFANKKIVISKRAENDSHYLLKTLFKNKAKVWSTDEVLDDWESAEDAPIRKIYNAGITTNRKIAEITTTKDFLLVNTRNISINPKYLKK